MNRTHKIVSLILCFAVLFGLCPLFSGAEAATLNQQKDQLQSQLAAQKKEQEQLSAQLSAAKKDVKNQLAVIQLIYDEMNSYQNQMNTLMSLISEYTELAKVKEAEIDVLNAQIDQNFDLFKQRLVFAQESGNMSYIDFILGSSDLSDIISRTEVINDMLEYDRKIIESLISDRETVEKAKAEIEDFIRAREEQQAEYEAIVETLKVKKEEADALLAEMQSKQQDTQEALNIAAAAKKKTEDALEEVIQKIAEQSRYNSVGPTGFIWPVSPTAPGGISRGWIEGYHSGLDIHVGGWVNNGKVPALAIASGKVVRTGSYYDWGNLVVVDHGGGYLSYYAHLHTISVSAGQEISQGQPVGKIGSTGDSTGPHLHLVIYAPEGSGGASIRVDPKKYLVYPQ